jgi:UDP-hydrolysing UDP-N-acetyl-D-glucosamine 2-epimerase
MRKIAVTISYRGAYARLNSLVRAIRDSAALELQLIVGASALLEKYGGAASVIERDGVPIAARVYMVLEGENPVTMAKTAGIGITEMATVFDNLRPDAAVVIGDRTESLGIAMAAAYMNIPVVHVQGGEVSGSIDEKVRHAITKLADLHFVANEDAAQRVERMGEDRSRIHVTGCPSIDLARASVQDRRVDLRALFEHYGVGPTFSVDGHYLLVVQHPVTTEYDEASEQIEQTLQAIYELRMPTIWLWPNVDAGSDRISKGIRIFRERYNPAFIHFFKNLPPGIFYKVLINSRCLVGSSSVGIRESSFLGVPVVNIGSRQAGRLRGRNVVDVGHEKDAIKAAVLRQSAHGPYEPEPLYGDGRAGERMAAILAEAPLTIHKRITY